MIASIGTLIGPAQCETLGFASFQSVMDRGGLDGVANCCAVLQVQQYQSFFLYTRSQLKGVYLGLRKRQPVPPVRWCYRCRMQ